MNTLTKYCCFFLLLLFWACGDSTIVVPPDTPVVEPMTLSYSKPKFPESWFGKWKGMLAIHKLGSDTTKIPMELHIQKNDSIIGWDWKIIYGHDKKDVRNYELYVQDKERGHYVIDEKNGIVIDAFYLGKSLFSRFSVGGYLLLVEYQRRGEELIVEIISSNETPLGIRVPEIKRTAVDSIRVDSISIDSISVDSTRLAAIRGDSIKMDSIKLDNLEIDVEPLENLKVASYNINVFQHAVLRR